MPNMFAQEVHLGVEEVVGDIMEEAEMEDILTWDQRAG